MLAAFGALLLTALILCIVYVDNKTVDCEIVTVKSPASAPAQIKIAHLSDLHFPRVKADTGALAERLLAEKPDIIAVTGDLIDDSADVRTSGAAEFIEKIKDIAPVFYVNGNHETRVPKQAVALYEILKANGVRVLRNESVRLTVNGAGVTVIGTDEDTDYGAECLKGNFDFLSDYRV